MPPSTTSTPPPTPTTPTTPHSPNSRRFPASPSQHQPTSLLSRPRSPIHHRPTTRRRRRPHPSFPSKIQHLRTALSPLVSLTTGHAHPSFPSTLLGFWLLTSAQLDDLAAFYHQAAEGAYSRHYPCPVYRSWRAAAGLEEKRRRLGRFVGLRGCESPVRQGMGEGAVEMEGVMGEEGRDGGGERELVMQSVQDIEREVREEREKRAERERFAGGKGRWY